MFTNYSTYAEKTNDDPCAKGSRSLHVLRTVCDPAPRTPRESRADGARGCGAGWSNRPNGLSLGEFTLVPESRAASAYSRTLKTEECANALSRKINNLQETCDRLLTIYRKFLRMESVTLNAPAFRKPIGTPRTTPAFSVTA